MPILIEGQSRSNPHVKSKEADPPSFTQMRCWDNVILAQGYSFARQLLSQESSQLTLTKYVPKQLIEKYCRAAMKRASPRRLEDGSWYADIPGFNGVWSNEETPQDCLNVLDEVLLDWLLLKIEGEDRDIPVADGIDLNVL